MKLTELFNDKTVKPKAKTELLSQRILGKDISVTELIDFAKTQKDSPKATCIEALEFATTHTPSLLDKEHFAFIVASLKEKAPRIKWESAKVIAHTAHLHIRLLDKAIINLLENTEDKGTVVRWSAALALGEIVKLRTKYNEDLLPAIETILTREDKNSIRKIYQAALKKINSPTKPV